MNNMAGIIFVLLALGTSMLGIKVYEVKKAPRPEIPRKMVHILMGCVTLSFPFVFTELWPVLFLGVVSSSALIAVRFSKYLKKNMGSVLHGVDRHSYGELYFPLAVVVLFILSRDQIVLYVVPILMLTFADSTAALIGSSYGRKALSQGSEDSKSLEGSFVFFNVAFMSTLAPLLLFTNIGRAETLLISLIMGLLVALIELVSQDGNDNLFIPLLGYAFLKLHMSLTVTLLIQSLWMIAILFVFGRLWNKRGSLSRLGILGGLVCTYTAALLGGWLWLVVMLLAFITYPIFPRMTEAERALTMDYPILLTNVTIGMFWLWIGFVTNQLSLTFYPFVLAFSAHHVMNMYIRLSLYHTTSGVQSLAISVLKAMGVIVLPAYWINRTLNISLLSGMLVISTFVGLCLAALAVSKLRERFDYSKVDVKNGWWNAFVVFAITGFQFILVWSVIKW